jgi:hypothetical protein
MRTKTNPLKVTKFEDITSPLKITKYEDNLVLQYTNMKPNLNNILEIPFAHKFVVDHLYDLLRSPDVSLYGPALA